MINKNNIFILITFLIMFLLVVSCSEVDDIVFPPPPPPPPPIIEPNSFLKVGNEFTYQYDYDVECGTGYVSHLIKLSIDSIVVNDNDTIYMGTNTGYERSINGWQDNEEIDTVGIDTRTNTTLFIVNDAICSFRFAEGLNIPFNSDIGTIIDSISGGDLTYCKFDKRGDYYVGSQKDNKYSTKKTYTNCLISHTHLTQHFGNGFSASRTREYVYNNNYGLIMMYKSSASPTGPDGNRLSLIDVNF